MIEGKRKTMFIVSPISDTQSKELVLSLLDEKIDEDKYIWEIVCAKKTGYAIEMTVDAVDSHIDIVVVVGGNGTINEIARSLIHTSAALGIIPCGSGNGLARHLQISMGPREALEISGDGLVGIIDYRKINGMDFLCTCGVGFDALASLGFTDVGKHELLTYLEKTLQRSLKYQPGTHELETEDGTSRYKALLITYGNTSQYGNNAYVVPQVTLAGGLLDVTILELFTTPGVPALTFQLLNKTIGQNSRAEAPRYKRLRIHHSSPGVVHFDDNPM